MNVLSLFDGISCGQLALQKAGVSYDNYYASEIDKHAIKVTQYNYPNTIQLGSIEEWRNWELPKIDLLIGGSPCFTAKTKIITQRGIENIDDVVVGDYVLTHKNRFKKVLKVGGKDKDKVIKIKAQGILDLEVTEEHPIFVRKMSRKWDNEKRKVYRYFSEPFWKKAVNLENGDFIGFPILNKEENPFNITEEEAFIIGRYIADGHTIKHFKTNRPNNRQWGLVLSIGKSKLEQFRKKIKNNHYFCIEHTQSVYRCTFSSKRLVEIVEKHCGCGAENKHFSMMLLNLPTSLLSIIIDGYLSGDGSLREHTYRATTISSSLVFSLSLAVAKVYKVGFSIYYTKKPPKCIIENRIVNQKDTYEISFIKKIEKQSNYKIIDDIIWFPFKRIKNIEKEQKVFNLEVEEDNSYTANGAIVHNCQGFSISGNKLNFNDPRSRLFFYYVDILKELKPKYFLLENVKMKKDWMNNISSILGVEPLQIDSTIFSAQRRERLYWTNIKGIKYPSNKNINAKDILANDVTIIKNGLFDEEKIELKLRGHGWLPNRVILTDKIPPLFTSNTDYFVRTKNNTYRKLTPIEYERLQTIKDDYTSMISETQRYKVLGNCWTVDVVAYILSFLKE